MQDNFVGDIGDFSKFGLLRAMAGICPEAEPELALGVVWYVPDLRTIAETDPGYGQNLGYLDQGSAYRDCDPALFDCLRDLVTHSRSLAVVALSGILGEGTRFWSAPIPPTRTRWLEQALSATADSDIVFLDPDVGLATSAMEQKQKPSPKHVHRDEVRAFLRLSRRQTVVVYQHYPRTHSARQSQVEAWRAALRTRIAVEPPTVLVSGNREFVVLAADRHADIVNDRLTKFLSGHWGRHMESGILRSH